MANVQIPPKSAKFLSMSAYSKKAQKDRERSDYSPYCFVLTTQKYPTCINKGPTNLKHYNDPNDQRGGSPRSTHCFQEILHIPLMANSVQMAH